jgi:hypothetical protein
LVSPNPMGLLNQKNLWPTMIYQFEHLGHPNIHLFPELCAFLFLEKTTLCEISFNGTVLKIQLRKLSQIMFALRGG